MRSILFALLLVPTTWACKTEPPPDTTAGGSVNPSHGTPPEVGDPGSANRGEPPPVDCSALQGHAWDGKADGCVYEVAGCCYGTPEAACTAAGCPGDACRILESAPAQIACPPTG